METDDRVVQRLFGRRLFWHANLLFSEVPFYANACNNTPPDLVPF